MATDKWVQVPQGWKDFVATNGSDTPPELDIRLTDGAGTVKVITDQVNVGLLDADAITYEVDFYSYGGLGKSREVKFTFTWMTDYFTSGVGGESVTSADIGSYFLVAIRWGGVDAADFADGWRTVFVGRLSDINYNDDHTVTLTAMQYFDWWRDNNTFPDYYAMTPDRYVTPTPITYRGRDAGDGAYHLYDRVESEELDDYPGAGDAYGYTWPKTYSLWAEQGVDSTFSSGVTENTTRVVRVNGPSNYPPHLSALSTTNHAMRIMARGKDIDGNWMATTTTGLNWTGAWHPVAKPESEELAEWAYHYELWYSIWPPSIRYTDSGTTGAAPYALLSSTASGWDVVSGFGGHVAIAGRSPKSAQARHHGSQVYRMRLQDTAGGSIPVGPGSIDVTLPFFVPWRDEPSVTSGHPHDDRFNSWRRFGIRKVFASQTNQSPWAMVSGGPALWYPYEVYSGSDETHLWNDGNINHASLYCNWWQDAGELSQPLWPDAREYPGYIEGGLDIPLSGSYTNPWFKLCYSPGLALKDGYSGMQAPGGVSVGRRAEPAQFVYALLNKLAQFERPGTLCIDAGDDTPQEAFFVDAGYPLVTGSYDNAFSWVGATYFTQFVNRWNGVSKWNTGRGIWCGLSEDDINPETSISDALEIVAQGVGMFLFQAPWGGLDLWMVDRAPQSGDITFDFRASLSMDPPVPGDQSTRNAWDLDYTWHDFKTTEHVIYNYRCLKEVRVEEPYSNYQMPTGVLRVTSGKVHNGNIGVKSKAFGKGRGLLLYGGETQSEITASHIGQDIYDVYSNNFSEVALNTPLSSFWDKNGTYLMRIGQCFNLYDGEIGDVSQYWITGFHLDIIKGYMKVLGVSAGAEPGSWSDPTADPADFVAPEDIDYGTQLPNVSITRQCYVQNTGTGGPLTGTVSYTGDSQFTVTAGSGYYSLQPGERQYVDVTLNAATTGTFSGTLTFTTGSDSTVTVSASVAAASCTDADASHDFGQAFTGYHSDYVWSVTNSGNAPLSGTLAVSTTSPSGETCFWLMSGQDQILSQNIYCAVGSTVSATLRFQPLSEGPKAGTLTTPCSNLDTVTLAGSGSDYIGWYVSPANIVFRTQNPDESFYRNVTVFNTRPYTVTGTLTIDTAGTSGSQGIWVSNTGSATYINTTGTFTLTSGETKYIRVLASSADAGDKFGHFELGLDGTGAPALDASAYIDDFPNDYYITPRTINFNQVSVGLVTVSETFTLSNTGSAAFDYDLSMIGNDTAAFAIIEATTGTLDPGSSTSFTLTFDPRRDGLAVANISMGLGNTYDVLCAGAGYNQFRWNFKGDTLDIGETFSGTATNYTASVTNYGDVAVVVTATAPSGWDFLWFGPAFGYEVTIPASTTQAFRINFSGGGAAGVHTDSFAFSGTSGTSGIPSDFTAKVLNKENTYAAYRNPSDINFGSVGAGESSSQIPTTFVNVGTRNIPINSIIVSGNTDCFSITNEVGSSTVVPGATYTAYIEFTPTGTGQFWSKYQWVVSAYSGLLGFRYTELTGTGVPGVPEIGAAPTWVNLGTPASGVSVTGTFIIKNNGWGTLAGSVEKHTLTSWSVTNNYVFEFVQGSGAFSLGHGETHQVDVSFYHVYSYTGNQIFAACTILDADGNPTFPIWNDIGLDPANGMILLSATAG